MHAHIFFFEFKLDKFKITLFSMILLKYLDKNHNL
jgi:hypothetical protein